MEKALQKNLWPGVVQVPAGPRKRLGESANWAIRRAYKPDDRPFLQCGKS